MSRDIPVVWVNDVPRHGVNEVLRLNTSARTHR